MENEIETPRTSGPIVDNLLSALWLFIFGLVLNSSLSVLLITAASLSFLFFSKHYIK